MTPILYWWYAFAMATDILDVLEDAIALDEIQSAAEADAMRHSAKKDLAVAMPAQRNL